MTDEEVAAALKAPAKRRVYSDDDVAKALSVQPSHDLPVGVRAPDPEPGLLDRAVDTAKQIGHAGKSLGQIAWEEAKSLPGSFVSNISGHGRTDYMTQHPEARREFLRNAADAFPLTTGWANRLADAAGRKMGDTDETSLSGTRAADQTAKSAAVAEGRPDASAAGQGLGMVLPLGVDKLASRAAGSLLGKVAAKGAAANAGMGVAKSVLGYEMVNPALAAGGAFARGEDSVEAAKRAATDPLALVVATGAGAVHGGAKGFAEDVRDPKNLSGRVIRDVEEAGGKIKAVGKPVAGGLYESPELTELEKGRAGINDLAGKSVGRIVESHQERLAKAREAFGDATDQIIAEHGDKHIPTMSAHKALDAIDADNSVNGITGDEKVAAATKKLRQMLTTKTDQLDGRASAASGEPVYVTAPAVKAADLIKARKLVNKMFRHTTEPAERHVYGQVLDAMADDASAADPRIMEMNRAYRQEMQSLSAANDSLFGQKRPELKDSEGTRQAAAARLGRLGDETQAGTLAEPRMERAAEESPQVARELRLNRAKKAMERLRYGKPETSMPIEKGMANAAEHGARKAVGGLVGGAAGAVLGHGLGAAIGAGVGASASEALANPLALKVRMGLPAAESVARNVQGTKAAITADRLIEMARRRKEEQERAAAILRGQ